MTTETTDPLEQALMEAAEEYALVTCAEHRERLRLHVQLALAKARHEAYLTIWDEDGWGRELGEGRTYKDLVREVKAEIAALEARLQEASV